MMMMNLVPARHACLAGYMFCLCFLGSFLRDIFSGPASIHTASESTVPIPTKFSGLLSLRIGRVD